MGFFRFLIIIFCLVLAVWAIINYFVLKKVGIEIIPCAKEIIKALLKIQFIAGSCFGKFLEKMLGNEYVEVNNVKPKI